MSHSRTAIAGCPCSLVPAFPAPCRSSGDTNAREKRQTMVLQEGSVNKQSHPDRLSPHCSNPPGTSDNWNCTGDACRTWGPYDVLLVRYGCTGAPRRCRSGGRSSPRHPLPQDFRGQTELNLETVWLKTPLPRWLFFRVRNPDILPVVQTSRFGGAALWDRRERKDFLHSRLSPAARQKAGQRAKVPALPSPLGRTAGGGG